MDTADTKPRQFLKRRSFFCGLCLFSAFVLLAIWGAIAYTYIFSDRCFIIGVWAPQNFVDDKESAPDKASFPSEIFSRFLDSALGRDFISSMQSSTVTLQNLGDALLLKRKPSAKGQEEVYLAAIKKSLEQQLSLYKIQKIQELDKTISHAKKCMVALLQQNSSVQGQKKDSYLVLPAAGQKQLKNKLITSYVEAWVQWIKDQTILQAIDSKKAMQDYLSIPIIGEDKTILRLSQAYESQLARLAPLTPYFRKDDFDLRALQQLKGELDENIARVIRQLKTRIHIDEAILKKIAGPLSQQPDAFAQNPSDSTKMQPFIEKIKAAQIHKDAFLNAPISIKSKPERYWFTGFLPLLTALSLLLCVVLARLFLFIKNARLKKSCTVKSQRRESTEGDSISSVSFAELLNRFTISPEKRWAVFGDRAEQICAHLAMRYAGAGTKSPCRVVFVDLCGAETEAYVGQRLGISDLILGRCTLSEALYHDENIGVDFLSRGQAHSFFLNEDFEMLDSLFKNLEQTYDLVLIAVSQEPSIPLHHFLKPSTPLIVLDGPSGRDSEFWKKTLYKAQLHNLMLLWLDK